MLTDSVNAADVAQAVRAFDGTFREMEQVAWRLSQQCRIELLSNDATLHLEELVWLVKKWMGIQGVLPSIKGIAAQAVSIQEVAFFLSLTPNLRRALDFKMARRSPALPKACSSSFSSAVRASS